MKFKTFVCIHTQDTNSDKYYLSYRINMLNDMRNILHLHHFKYRDWIYTAPDSSTTCEWQNSIDENIIDKGDIIIALISDVIEGKKLKYEIEKILSLKENKTINFLICFKSFSVDSNDGDDCSKLIKILDYKKELHEKNTNKNMDFMNYNTIEELWNKLELYMINWLKYEYTYEAKNASQSVTKIEQVDIDTSMQTDKILSQKGI